MYQVRDIESPTPRPPVPWTSWTSQLHSMHRSLKVLVLAAALAAACIRQPSAVVLACETRGGDDVFSVTIEGDRASVHQREWEVQTTDTQYRLADLTDSGRPSLVTIRIDRVTGHLLMLVPDAEEKSYELVRGACVPGERKF